MFNMSDVKVEDFRVYEKGSLKGFCKVTFFDCIEVKSCKLMDGSNGYWVAMPSIQKSDGDWENLIWIDDEGLKEELTELAIDAYENAPRSESSNKSRRRSRNDNGGRESRRTERKSSRRR